MEAVRRVGDLRAITNIRTVRRAFKALTSGNVGGGDEFVSPDYFDHEAWDAAGAPPRRGPDQFCQSVEWLHHVLADPEFEEREVIAAGGRVMVRGVMRGRHVGPLLGIAPTGECVEIHQMHIFRLAGQQVVEHRALWGELSLLAQLGVVPS